MDGSIGIVLTDNDSKVLLVKRRDVPIWVLPGGGIEEGETPQDAAIRETFEETGYNVKILRKCAEYTYSNKKITHTFECSVIGGHKTLSNESKEIEFYDVKNLPKMSSPFIQQFIDDALSRNSNLIIKDIKKLPFSFWIRGLTHPWAMFKYLLTQLGIHWNT